MHLCAWCGVEFTRKSQVGRRPKFCSSSCRTACRRAQSQTCECAKCGGEFEASRSVWPTPDHCPDCRSSAKCLGCGVEFPSRVNGGRPRKFCSPACQQASLATGSRACDCSDCGAQFTAGSRGPKPSRCANCRRSGLAAERKRAACEHCGAAYVLARTGQKFCSDRCREQSYRKGGVKFVNKSCEYCSVELGSVHPQKRFCGGNCARKFREADMTPGERRARWERKRANWQRRRALKKGATVGPPFTILDVISRDGWQCSLCGEVVDGSLVYPDPRSLSLDHVVPLNRGGEHSLTNAALAHLECNVIKGDRWNGGWANVSRSGRRTPQTPLSSTAC